MPNSARIGPSLSCVGASRGKKKKKNVVGRGTDARAVASLVRCRLAPCRTRARLLWHRVRASQAWWAHGQTDLAGTADTVFLSPPWGGPDYARVKTYDIKTMLKPRDGYSLFNTAKEIASRLVMFLPRNVDLNQLAELCLSAHPPWALEVEKNYLNGKLKAITAYFNTSAVDNKSV